MRYVLGHAARDRRRPFLDRFWEKVAKGDPDECWRWLGYIDRQGYGFIATEDGKAPLRAHRAAFIIGHRRPIDDGRHIHHTCGNRWCVNPAHLEAMTNSEHRRLHWAAGDHDRDASGRIAAPELI